MNPALPLDDIILPPAVSAWPPAPGWWVLALLGVVALAVALTALWRWWRYRQQLQQARRALQQRCQGLQDSDLCRTINEWLKINARARYPQAPALHGSDWVAFLNQSAGQPLFSGEQAQALAEGPYQPGIHADADALCALAYIWLQRSRALRGGRS